MFIKKVSKVFLKENVLCTVKLFIFFVATKDIYVIREFTYIMSYDMHIGNPGDMKRDIF